MESRHRDALRRLVEADASLASDGREPESFILQHTGDGPRVDHPRWDPSWAVPNEHTIDDLDELGLVRVLGANGKARTFGLTMAGRRSKADAEVEAPSGQPDPVESPSDPTRVAVMHGRDEDARVAVHGFLHRIGLKPLEWENLVNLTGDAAPYNGQAVEAAFAHAQAVVVVLTPDDIGFLHPDLLGEREREDDRDPTGQARLNVVLEAGMALQSHGKRTVFVEIGQTRGISDLAGRNTVRLDGSAQSLKKFANRLEIAKCPVDLSGDDWLDGRAFERLAARTRTAGFARPAPGGAIREARRVAVELETIDRTLHGALESGFWWNVTFEGLPGTEFDACRDELAEQAGALHDVVAEIYVEADQLNKAAHNHAQGGVDDLPDGFRQRFERLREDIERARKAIGEYVGERQLPTAAKG